MTLSDPFSHLSELELVRLAAHNERAFEVLVKRHAPAVYRLAASTVGSGAADDIVQEVFMALHRSLKTFRGEAQLSTWLHRVTLNACAKLLSARQNLALEAAPELAAPHNPAQAGENADLRERLAAALQTLPREQREAVTLREISGLDYAEIAELTGAELGTVKSRINRGRAALREWLQRAGVKP
ncbi:RNA polymerase sigma factor [Deinococcus xinjiangensis]|uniref:RNA polymerase sigma factor n=1 Tax=Deinococcus xinjiangensis TaxID=457454 RepID=UPI003EB88A51